MPRRPFRLWPLLKETAREWNADNCLRLGASLSYYALFSLFPLILVVLAIVRLLLTSSDAGRDAIVRGLASITGGFREDFVSALDAAIQTRAAAGILGSIMLVLGASWVFGELASAFNIIWDVEEPSRGGPLEFLRAPIFSFVLVLVVACLLLVSMLISAALAALAVFTAALPGAGAMGGVLQFAINLGVLTLLFALLFRYVPRTRVAWNDVWLGAGLTAITWTLLQFAIAYYIALSSYKDYGAIGASLALVAWVFLSSQILFVGGEFTAVYARHYGSRALPLAGAASAGAPRDSWSARVPSSFTGIVRPAPVASDSMVRGHLTTGGIGITLGVIGTLLALGLACVVATVRAARRLGWR